MTFICKLFGKSRQAWYDQCRSNTEEQLTETLVLKLVEEIRRQLPRVGVIKLHEMLRESFKAHGIKMGRDALYELLGNCGYLLRYRRRKPYTTDSNHRFKKYPNLIREMILTQADQLWVSDITYIRLQGGKYCYLSIITDAYSRKIAGHCLHPTLHTNGTINALETALKQRSSRWRSLVHHSDRGTQYCSSDYVRLLEQHQISISMTEKGDPYENAIAERVNGILKHEFDLHRTFNSLSEAEAAVNHAIRQYNHIRPHASCDYMTPVAAHTQTGLLKKRWRRPEPITAAAGLSF